MSQKCSPGKNPYSASSSSCVTSLFLFFSLVLFLFLWLSFYLWCPFVTCLNSQLILINIDLSSVSFFILQLDSADEQAAAIRRELDGRIQKCNEMERVSFLHHTLDILSLISCR